MSQTYPWHIMESFAPLVLYTRELMGGRTWSVLTAGYYPLDVPTYWQFVVTWTADGATWTNVVVHLGTPP
jgi:hypothetical protein